MSELVGQTLGHFRIVEKIGAGGMGEVYKARDEKLDRDVAIKVLPEEMARDPERFSRFEREAKAVARLAHPNILDIYQLGEYGDRSYIVTEVLEGQSLSQRLHGGRLSWRKAAEIGAAIADGLAAAHRAGVIHRDLKPSNVFLTSDGRVKVIDFGLARIDEAVDQEADTVTHSPEETQAGAVLGTVGYMSPEQVAGKPADARSDIFSLGCVLYELVSGVRAFKGNTGVETMNAILKQDPPEISSSEEAIPPELAGAIGRCLEKSPDARFQSASDLAYALRTVSGVRTPTGELAAPITGGRRRTGLWLAVAAVAAIAAAVGLAVWAPWQETAEQAILATESEAEEETQWVAVAPLENRTGDQTLDNLGQRAVGEIVRRFSEIGQAAGVLTMDAVSYPPGSGATGVRVRRDGQPMGTVGPKGPHTLLSGIYYLDDDTVELQVRLTDYDTGELVYAFPPVSAPRPLATSALEELQDRVVAALDMHWHPRQDIRVMNPPSSFAARLAVKRGTRQSMSGNYQEAVDAYEQALEIDPEYYIAFDMRVRALLDAGRNKEALEQVESAEKRFEKLTPFERSYLRNLTAIAHGDIPGALIAVRQMAEIAPRLNWVQYQLVALALNSNRPREALEVAARNPDFFVGRGSIFLLQAHHALGEYQQELDGATQGIRDFPSRGDFYFHKVAALAALGHTEEVDRIVEKCMSVQLEQESYKMNLAQVIGLAALELRAHGHRDVSTEVARKAAEWYDRRQAGTEISEYTNEELRSHSIVLRVSGRWAESGELFRELERRGYQPVFVTGVLGVVAARTGDHGEAWKRFERLAGMNDPFVKGAALYWRACIAAQLGKRERAVELLQQAYSEGLRHNSEYHCDVDCEPLWDYPPFQELIAPKG